MVSGLIATQGGFLVPTSMNYLALNNPVVATFRERLVMAVMRKYLCRVLGKQGGKLSAWPRGWAGQLRRGDWQKPHMHPMEKNGVSGAYYVNLPPDAPTPRYALKSRTLIRFPSTTAMPRQASNYRPRANSFCSRATACPSSTSSRVTGSGPSFPLMYWPSRTTRNTSAERAAAAPGGMIA